MRAKFGEHGFREALKVIECGLMVRKVRMFGDTFGVL